MDRERKENGADGGDPRDRDARAPSVRDPQEEPERLRNHDEEREVVRAQRQHGGDRPAGEVPRRALLERAQEREDRQPREQDQQCVRAPLLRVPDEQRVERDQPGGDEPHPLGDELATDGPGQRDRGRADECGERPQAHLAGTERARPQPRQDVVQRRRGLARGDCLERVDQARPEDPPDRDRLVVPEALHAERREPQARSEHGEPRQRPAVGQ